LAEAVARRNKKTGKECPAPGCDEQIERHFVSCGRHFFWLPLRLREEIMETGSLASHIEAIQLFQEGTHDEIR